MIRIVICDDNMKEEKWLEGYISSWFERKKILYSKRSFTSSRALLYEIEDGTGFDLLFLDIEMPGLNGMSLAEQIKKYLPDALIIFVTAYEKYVYKSFSVHPFQFIPKNLLKEMLPEALRDAVGYIEKNAKDFYVIENQKGIEKIPVGNIYYIWHKGKYAYLEKENGESSKVRKTLKQVFTELSAEGFAWVDRGCICNLAHISRLSGDVLYLDNGHHLQISKDRMTALKETLLKYWVKSGD